MKYVYNIKVYQVVIDPELESYLQVENGKKNPLNTLISTSKIESLKEKKNEMEKVTKLLEDDWGSLNFTPLFMGEYIITTKETEKKKETNGNVNAKFRRKLKSIYLIYSIRRHKIYNKL